MDKKIYIPTMAEREAAAGLNLAGGNTTSGRFGSSSRSTRLRESGQETRNEARKAEREEEKKEGKVNDLSLGYTPSNNEEGISTSTNDTMGNDEFSLADDDVVSSLNTLLLDYVKSDNTVAQTTFYVE